VVLVESDLELWHENAITPAFPNAAPGIIHVLQSEAIGPRKSAVVVWPKRLEIPYLEGPNDRRDSRSGLGHMSVGILGFHRPCLEELYLQIHTSMHGKLHGKLHGTVIMS